MIELLIIKKETNNQWIREMCLYFLNLTKTSNTAHQIMFIKLETVSGTTLNLLNHTHTHTYTPLIEDKVCELD